MLLYCEYEKPGSLTGYCMRPAETSNNVKGYDYLCRYHHMLLDGRFDHLKAIGFQTTDGITRTCPVCFKRFRLEPYRARSRLNFCSTSHRSAYYHPKGKQIGAEPL